MSKDKTGQKGYLERLLDRFSLDALLIVPFAFLGLIMVVFIGYLSINSGYKSARTATDNLLHEVTARINSDLRDYMELPHRINQLNLSAYLNGYLDINNRKSREIYFYSLMKNFPEIPYVFIGTPKGQFYGAARRKDSVEFEHVMRDDSTNGESRYFSLRPEGTSGEMTRAFPGFDPRKRPWYKTALEKGKPAWSAVYKHFVVNSLAITAVHPFYKTDGSLIGVFAVDILLSRLNDFLRKIELGKNGWIFIIEPSGMLVATSTKDALFELKDGSYRRIDSRTVDNSKLSRTARLFLSEKPEEQEISEVDIDGESYYIIHKHFSDSLGLDWIIMAGIPESDFFSPINRNIKETLVISTLVFLAFVLLGWLLARRITNPIRELSAAAKEVSQGRWDFPVSVDRKDEIGQLSRSFQTMAQQLQISFSSLERVVEVRTLALTLANKKLEEEIDVRLRTEAELIEAKRHAEEANNAKSDFIAMISHEIRTPMNGVVGMASVLLDSELSDEQRRGLMTIITSGDALLSIINQVLDFSKIESGSIEVVCEPFNLRALCEQVKELLKVQIKVKGLNISLDYNESTPDCFIGDAGKIRQVIMNLAGNAIKFTDEGSIRMKVESESLSEGVHRVKISVIDTGLGIPEDKFNDIFNKFTQIEDNIKGRATGTGLGLSISKRLVEMMGGSISLSSVYGQGSSFWFVLDLKEGNIASCANDRHNSVTEGRMFHNVKVLLAEDNLINQMVAEQMLNKFGCSVDIASNGEEALRMIESKEYDMVLMDCAMPIMDGFEATRAIRDRLSINKVPIVAITANATDIDKKKCLEAGMNDFISKPMSIEAIYNALDRWIPPQNEGR